MEKEAAQVLAPWLAQLGIFGLGLAVIGLFLWLWLRESRGIRGEIGTALSRKNEELEAVKKERDTAIEARDAALEAERRTYAELMACRFPDTKGKHGRETNHP